MGFSIGDRVRYIGGGLVWVVTSPAERGRVFIRATDRPTEVRAADSGLLVLVTAAVS